MSASSAAKAGLALAVAALAGCAAAPAPKLRVVDATNVAASARTRVLGGQVDLRRPLAVGVEDRDVTVTYGFRRCSVAKVRLDAGTLAVVASERVDAACDVGVTSGDPSGSAAKLDDGAAMTFWTDPVSGALLARTVDENGAPRSAPFVVWNAAPDESIVGPPRAASPDGRRVVVAWFVAGEEGFQLSARSLDRADVEAPPRMTLTCDR